MGKPTDKEKLEQLQKMYDAYKEEKDMEIKKLKEEKTTLKAERKGLKTEVNNSNRDKRLANGLIEGLKYKLEKAERRLLDHTVDVARRIAWKQKYQSNHDDRERLERFNNGEMYDEYSFPFFSEDFFIRYNPKNGRPLDDLDVLILGNLLLNRAEYNQARYELRLFKKNNPNYTEEELQTFIYKKGMELLPLYKDYIL